MLNFSLTNLFTHNIININLNALLKSNPAWFIRDDIIFSSVNGGFPYSYWNGGTNMNWGTFFFYPKIVNFVLNYKATTTPRLNFGNININNLDFQDNQHNLVLEAFQNGSTMIEVSNMELMEYIKKTYQYYNYFILSKQADLITEFTPELLNTISEYNKFSLIELPERCTNIEFINKLQNKSKFEITLNPSCINCTNNIICTKNEQLAQYAYSIKTKKVDCNHKDLCNYTIKGFDILNNYIKLGITSFKFEPFSYTDIEKDPTYYARFLVEYFIKPEYQYKAYVQLLRKEIDN